MAALIKTRDTKRRDIEIHEFGVGAAKTCYGGGIAVLNGGYLEPGATALNLIAVGRFEADVDNSAGAAGDLNARVRRGVFRFANSTGGDLIAAANIGADCYIVDDQTVALTDGTGTRSRAGVITDVDANGVWVAIGFGY